MVILKLLSSVVLLACERIFPTSPLIVTAHASLGRWPFVRLYFGWSGAEEKRLDGFGDVYMITFTEKEKKCKRKRVDRRTDEVRASEVIGWSSSEPSHLVSFLLAW